MKIAVFCSANSNIAPEFFTLTEELGKWMGEQGHTLIYGGQNRGLMKCIGDAVHNGGGMLIGMIPQILAKGGQCPDNLDVEVPCDSLSDRKDLMLAQADVCVALPGGIGTLDEIFSIAASHNIGYHAKMVILYNMKDFYHHLIEMLDYMQEQGFMRSHWTDYIKVANNFEELKALLH